MEFEYVPGGSLDTHTNFSTSESTQILYQLSSALEYLHNQQPSVGHRDIKPANVLVVERGVDGIYVKFADFGLSKAADTLKTFCGTLEWAAPEIYLKAADQKGTANDIYSVAVDIWSLGVVIASLECGRLPVYEEAWATDAVAWIHTVQRHVTDHLEQQGNELLWLVLDNMLVEDPEERSSADYCSDEALKLLQHIADTRRQESDDDDDGSTTPNPSMLGAQSAVESGNSEGASTFRLNIQSASSDGSETSIREKVEDIDESLIDSKEEWERSGIPDLDAPPSWVPDASVAVPQRSMVDGFWWNPEDPEPASLTSNHDGGATTVGAGEAQTKVRPVEDHGISSSLSLTRSLTHPLSGAQKRAVGGDIYSSKRHKRSKRDK